MVDKITIFKDEDGKALAIVGKHEGKIEYGEDNTRAEAQETLDLAEEMTDEEAQEWIEKQLKQEDSKLRKKFEEYQEDDE